MPAHPLVRTIYLYVFSFIGLILLTIGGVGFVKMGLKAFLFTQADRERMLYEAMPPRSPAIERLERARDSETLASEEQADVEEALAEYRKWEKARKGIDPVQARRHREAADNLAFILIGLPLYLFHWRLVRRESPEKRAGF